MRLPDSTLPLRLDPDGFVSRRARAEGRDAFRTRLLLRPALCLTGPAAGELFYDEARITRVGAAPESLQRTLFGQGGVQGLDGAAHRTRKAVFQALRGRESVTALVEAADTAWESRLDDWASRGEVVLYDEMLEVLTVAACRWAGAPLPGRDVARRTRQVTLLFDAASGVGPRHLLARRARVRLEDWAAVDVLTRRLDWQAPASSLRLAMRRVPALPRNRFVVREVRRSHQAAGA